MEEGKEKKIEEKEGGGGEGIGKQNICGGGEGEREPQEKRRMKKWRGGRGEGEDRGAKRGYRGGWGGK